MKKLRVVIDTNVLISAALSPLGAPAQVVRQVLDEHLIVFSDATFVELETRLWKPKFDRYVSLDLRKSLLHDLSAASHWAKVSAELGLQKFSRDVDDDMFVHAALASGSALLITGDQDLLVLARHIKREHAIEIRKPADAVGLLASTGT